MTERYDDWAGIAAEMMFYARQMKKPAVTIIDVYIHISSTSYSKFVPYFKLKWKLKTATFHGNGNRSVLHIKYGLIVPDT